MSDAIDKAQNNPDIRCIIITGGSGVFTAGNDLEDFLKESTSEADAPRGASNAVKLLYSLAHNVKPIIAAVDGVAIGIGTTMLFHCDYVLASKTATFSTPFINLGLVPEGASSLLMPRTMGYQRAFAMLVMGRKFSADDAREAGFVNVVVAPGHTEAEARKVAREICALPAEAVAISRKLLRPPPEDMTRRIDQEGHLFGERMRSKEAIAAFKAFCAEEGVDIAVAVGQRRVSAVPTIFPQSNFNCVLVAHARFAHPAKPRPDPIYACHENSVPSYPCLGDHACARRVTRPDALTRRPAHSRDQRFSRLPAPAAGRDRDRRSRGQDQEDHRPCRRRRTHGDAGRPASRRTQEHDLRRGRRPDRRQPVSVGDVP